MLSRNDFIDTLKQLPNLKIIERNNQHWQVYHEADLILNVWPTVDKFLIYPSKPKQKACRFRSKAELFQVLKNVLDLKRFPESSTNAGSHLPKVGKNDCGFKVDTVSDNVETEVLRFITSINVDAQKIAVTRYEVPIGLFKRIDTVVCSLTDPFDQYVEGEKIPKAVDFREEQQARAAEPKSPDSEVIMPKGLVNNLSRLAAEASASATTAPDGTRELLAELEAMTGREPHWKERWDDLRETVKRALKTYQSAESNPFNHPYMSALEWMISVMEAREVLASHAPGTKPKAEPVPAKQPEKPTDTKEVIYEGFVCKVNKLLAKEIKEMEEAMGRRSTGEVASLDGSIKTLRWILEML